jgi:uncharacterized protein YbjT (DUF2867 family)
MTVLVIGATGHVGCQVVRQLLARDVSVHALTRAPGRARLPAEQVRLIGEAIGRPVVWEEEPPDEALRRLGAQWGKPAFAEHALEYWASLVEDPEPTTDTVEVVTGRPAAPFAEWARDHADDFK